MDAIGPGDYVEYVDDLDRRGEGHENIGQIYFVYAVGKCLAPAFKHVDCVFTLLPHTKYKNKNGDVQVYGGTRIDRFRPIYRRGDKNFNDLMQNIPSDLVQDELEKMSIPEFQHEERQ